MNSFSRHAFFLLQYIFFKQNFTTQIYKTDIKEVSPIEMGPKLPRLNLEVPLHMLGVQGKQFEKQ